MNVTTTPGGGQEKSRGGGRNCALVSEAGRLRKQGLEEPEIFERLMESPSRQGLPESEVRTIAKSVCRYPAGERRPGPGEPDPYAGLSPVEELARRRGWTVSALESIGARAAPDGKDGKREVHFPMCRASKKGAGEITGWRRRLADNGKFGEGEEAKKALTVKGGKNGLLMPEGFDSIPENETVLVVEGEADLCAALSAGRRAVVGTPGATPGKRPLEDLQRLLAGRRDVVLAPDPDPAGEKWRDELARLLKNAQCNVRYIPAGGGDLDKRLRLEPPGRRAGALGEMITEAVPWRESPAGATESTGSGSGKKPKSKAGESTASLATPPESAAAGEQYPIPDSLSGLALDFADRQSLKSLFIPELKQWFMNISGVWLPDSEGESVRHALQGFALGLRREAQKTQDPKQIERAIKLADMAGKKTALSALEPHLSENVARLDAHPFFICSSDGVVYDLEKRETRRLDPLDYITKAFGARWDSSAKCPRWERFLEEIWRGDRAMISYFRKLLGYCMTGDVRERKYWILWGHGAGGKSVLISTLGDLFGDCFSAAPFGFFSARPNKPNRDLAYLRGVRLMAGSAWWANPKNNYAAINEFVRCETITALGQYKQVFNFQPTHKLMLMTNNLPCASSDDTETWKRLRVIPFPENFEGARDDQGLKEKLRAELPGILQWGIHGAIEWMECGLGEEPECMRKIVEAYKRDADPVARFISEACESAPGHRESARSLWLAYNQWATGEGEREATPQWFGRRMKEMGHAASHGEGGTLYRDLRLLPSWRVSSGYQGGAPEDSPE